MEGLLTTDGTPLAVPDIEREFAKAMSAPPSDDYPAPPKTPAADQAASPKPRTRHDKPRTARTGPSTVKPAPSSPEADKRRAEASGELLRGGAMVALVLSTQTGNDAFKADAVTLDAGADEFGGACAQLARVSPRFAAFIDKSGNGAPYLAFGMACSTIGVQLAVNHGLIPAGMMGTQKPADLIAQLDKADGPANTA
jgi:hypothetical protein